MFSCIIDLIDQSRFCIVRSHGFLPLQRPTTLGWSSHPQTLLCIEIPRPLWQGRHHTCLSRTSAVLPRDGRGFGHIQISCLIALGLPWLCLEWEVWYSCFFLLLGSSSMNKFGAYAHICTIIRTMMHQKKESEHPLSLRSQLEWPVRLRVVQPSRSTNAPGLGLDGRTSSTYFIVEIHGNLMFFVFKSMCLFIIVYIFQSPRCSMCSTIFITCDRQLDGGLEHVFYDFPYIGNVIIPTDELHHFSEG